MRYSNQQITRALPIYAQHLAEQTGVKVIVGGSNACTDGKVVHVPMVKEGDASLAFGFMAHEISHVRNTDMDAFQEAASVPFRHKMLNALEDIRIERCSMDQYPGTEEDIRYLNRKVLLEPFSEVEAANAGDLQVVLYAVLMGAYWKLQEPQLEAPARFYMEALEKLVGKPIADQIMATAWQCLECNTTWEVLELVDEILALLPDDQDQQQQPPQQPQSQPQGSDDDSEESDESEQSGEPDAPEEDDNSEGEDGRESDSSDEGAGSNPGSDEDSSENDDEQPQSQSGQDGDGEEDSGDGSDAGSTDADAGDGAEGEQESDQDSGQGGNASPGRDDDQGDSESEGEEATGNAPSGEPEEGESPGNNLKQKILSATEEDLEELIGDLADAAAELLNAEAYMKGVVKPFQLKGRTKQRSDWTSDHRVALGAQESAGLRQILNGMLQGQVDCRVQLKRQGRRIDPGRIAMMKAGETRIFRHKARATRQSAAIQLLLDKSGSMQEAMGDAESAVYAVLRALEGLPLVSTGAMAFPDRYSQPFGCSLMKSHTESLGHAASEGGFGAVADDGWGGTPLAEALWPSLGQLFGPKTKAVDRKILFVITDGAPDNNATAREMVELGEASGVTVIGLGFGTATNAVLARVFNRYQNVGSVKNLRSVLFELVRGVLAA